MDEYRHGELAIDLDLGFLTCCDIPCLFHQPDSRIHRVLNLRKTDSAERRRIIAEVRRILGWKLE